MCQGQSSPFILEAEPVLVLPRFTLTLALTHTEDECRLLLVDRKPVDMAEVTRGMGGATLEKGCAAHFHFHQLRLRLLHLSRHT